MGLKLKWAPAECVDGIQYTRAKCAGFIVQAVESRGCSVWQIFHVRDAIVSPTDDPALITTTMEAAQEAAEAALARLLAEDDGLLALLGLAGTFDDFPILRTGGREYVPVGRARIERARAETAEARVAELERAARWIPVGESLPDDETVVVEALDDDGVVLATCVDDGRRGEWWPTHESRRADGITHWRPLVVPEVEK